MCVQYGVMRDVFATVGNKHTGSLAFVVLIEYLLHLLMRR